MMLGASSLKQIDKWVQSLERIGYEYVSKYEQLMPARRYFVKPRVGTRHFHLHAVVIGSTFWHEHLAFRDALRQNPALAAKYNSLKQQLAIKYADDREAYTNAKDTFISSIIQMSNLVLHVKCKA